MKQYKISLLVLIGVAFVILLAMVNFKGFPKLTVKDTGAFFGLGNMNAQPLQPSNQKRQMAVEVQPVMAPAPQAALLSSETTPQAQIITAPTEIAPADDQLSLKESDGVKSFIEFVSLTENYDTQGHGIDWRTYREYRRSVAKSPQPAL